MYSKKHIRPEALEAILKDVLQATKAYRQVGCGINEIGASFIFAGAELLITHLGPIDGLKSFEAIMADVKQTINEPGETL